MLFCGYEQSTFCSVFNAVSSLGLRILYSENKVIIFFETGLKGLQNE
jgi:hypothetical protein